MKNLPLQLDQEQISRKTSGPLRVLWLVLGLMPFHGQFLLAQSPIQLHPDNTRYLQYKEDPILLITSAEHYGAVLNLDFDYETYLNTLHEEGMNYTRVFTGSYVEVPGAFGIGNNTLAPAVGKYIAPWQRVEEAGQFQGEGSSIWTSGIQRTSNASIAS